ncbi:hypothetical protein [Oceanobacillus picturae]|uniref:hypothetical protein n=1 Tax=Oceanobacillus picturae TaxID=171693 RepID=UPI000E6837AA|nr:hypothetical protein [Oceanobacillus picturae]RIU93428.1 hypothetical protein D1864_08155 [Oceanobacillus picturae]
MPAVPNNLAALLRQIEVMNEIASTKIKSNTIKQPTTRWLVDSLPESKKKAKQKIIPTMMAPIPTA